MPSGLLPPCSHPGQVIPVSLPPSCTLLPAPSSLQACAPTVRPCSPLPRAPGILRWACHPPGRRLCIPLGGTPPCLFLPLCARAALPAFAQQSLAPCSSPLINATALMSAGWKGTWVCEADKHKALEMYKVGVPTHPHHSRRGNEGRPLVRFGAAPRQCLLPYRRRTWLLLLGCCAGVEDRSEGARCCCALTRRRSRAGGWNTVSCNVFAPLRRGASTLTEQMNQCC